MSNSATTPKMFVMVCGVDCHPGSEYCNGYCIGKAPMAKTYPAAPSARLNVKAVDAIIYGLAIDTRLSPAHTDRLKERIVEQLDAKDEQCRRLSEWSDYASAVGVDFASEWMKRAHNSEALVNLLIDTEIVSAEEISRLAKTLPVMK